MLTEASLDEHPRERADAMRNRRAILAATEELLAHNRPEHVSMERVAAAASVGKATVFHRFGSRMGLMVALMQERAVTLHEAVSTGPPPLGPGAPPLERLTAFLDAVVELIARNKGQLAALSHAAATAPAHQDRPAASPIYALWHDHVGALIAQARPDLDAELLAHIVLSALSSDPILRLLEQGEAERVAASLRTLALALPDDPRPL